MPDPGRSDDRLTPRRIAENEARVRSVNEEIKAAAQRLRSDLGLIPFVCECGRLECLGTLRLSLEDYREVRTDARWFICSPGHELTEAGHERVVKSGDGYVIVEKRGDAADVAEQLDHRAEAQ